MSSKCSAFEDVNAKCMKYTNNVCVFLLLLQFFIIISVYKSLTHQSLHLTLSVLQLFVCGLEGGGGGGVMTHR